MSLKSLSGFFPERIDILIDFFSLSPTSLDLFLIAGWYNGKSGRHGTTYVVVVIAAAGATVHLKSTTDKDIQPYYHIYHFLAFHDSL